MISSLLSLCSSKRMFIIVDVVLLIFVGLSIHKYNELQIAYVELESKYQKQIETIKEQNNQIESLKISIQSQNELMKSTIENNKNQTEDLIKIDKIMSDDSKEESESCNIKEKNNAITTKQNSAGIDLLNDMFNNVK